MENINEKIVRPERSRPGLFAASGFYLLAAVGLWAMVIASPYAARLIPGASQETLTLIVGILYYGVFLILPIALWASGKEGMLDGLRLNPMPPLTMLRTILVAVLCVLIVYDFDVFWMALWQKLGLNVFSDTYIRPANTGELMKSVISAGFVAAASEELLFRGVMLSAWERGGTKKAVLVTSALFAMVHGSLLGLPGEVFCGIVMALLVVYTDSLYTGMIFHTVYNSILVVVSYLSSSAETAETLAEDALLETDIISGLGGWTAVLPLVLEMAFMGLLLVGLLRGFRVRAKWFGMEMRPPQKVEISTGTAVLILAGAVTTLGLYVFDLISMLGG